MDPGELQIRRQRAPKTTADQYEVFLDFATRNPIIVDGKRGPLDTEARLHEKWDELADILNTSGRGPQRNTREWQNTFSNWKNSIRHKMKCIMDGTSRTMLNELEGRALQLWDLGAYNGLPRYARKREAPEPTPQADDGGQDESTHSMSAFYLGRHLKDEYSVNGDHSQQSHTNSIGHVELNGTGRDESAMLVAGGSTAATELDDEEDDEYEDEPSVSIAAVSNSTPLPTAKRRKYHHHHHQGQLLTAAGAAVGVQRRNGSTTRRGGADELDGSILIAESIAKLADNVGQMAESIREIAAAFTTTTQAAFELIRRQSEIIQGLIEK